MIVSRRLWTHLPIPTYLLLPDYSFIKWCWVIQHIDSAADDDDDDDDVWILSCAITEAEMKWDTITSQISTENRHRTQHVVDYVCSHAQDTYAITAVGLYSRCAAANNCLKIEFADGVITLQHSAVEVYHVVVVVSNSDGRDIDTDRKNDTKPGNFP